MFPFSPGSLSCIFCFPQSKTVASCFIQFSGSQQELPAPLHMVRLFQLQTLFFFLLGTKAPLYLCLWWSEGPLRLPPPARSDTSVTWTLLPGFAAGAVWEKWAPLAMSRSLRVCPEVDPSPYLWGSSVATPCPPTPCLLPSFLQDFLLFYCFQGKSVLNHLRAAACQVSRSLLRM